MNITERKMVLNIGNKNEWDSINVSSPYIIKEIINNKSIYKMWYSGYDELNYRIGYAVSDNGINWTKHGIVLDIGNKNKWDSLYAYNPCVIKDETDNIYKMWYSGNNKLNDRIGYAVSNDGIKWNKKGMVLDLGNNCKWDDIHIYSPHVIKDETNNTYQMWYSGVDNNNNSRIGYAISEDSVKWNKKGMVLDLGDVLKYDWDYINVYDPYVIKDNNTYKMWYTGWDGINICIGYTTSKDGVNWTKHGIVLDVDRDTENINDVSTPYVIIDNNTYKMWYTENNGTNSIIKYTELNIK